MPIITHSSYVSPWWLRNAHLATIIPSIFWNVKGVNYTRERITTPDSDFMDLDWVKNDSKKLLLLSHGGWKEAQEGTIYKDRLNTFLQEVGMW